MKIAAVIIFLLRTPFALCDLIAADGQTFECSEHRPYPEITGKWGYLSIKKDKYSCGFRAPEGFIAIRTADLVLTNTYCIVIDSERFGEKENRILYEPFEADYLGIGLSNPEISFKRFKTENSSILLNFIQADPIIRIRGDRSSSLTIRSIDVDHYNLEITRTLGIPLHVEVHGHSDRFGHYLFGYDNKEDHNIVVEKPVSLIKVSISCVRRDCSGAHYDEVESTHELAGPSEGVKNLDDFKCVNIFTLNLNSREAHYDVNFANFLGIQGNNDELIISDGSSTLKITKFNAKTYHRRESAVSFKGNRLAVIFSTPRNYRSTFLSRLTVRAKAHGDITDNDDFDSLKFECSRGFHTIGAMTEHVSIKKDQKSCSVKGSADTISIGANEPLLTSEDRIEIVSADLQPHGHRTIYGPIDYLVIGVPGPFIIFHFDVADNSSMMLTFDQFDENPYENWIEKPTESEYMVAIVSTKPTPIIKIQGDRASVMLIASVSVTDYELEITKTIRRPLHLEIQDSPDPVSHHLILRNEPISIEPKGSLVKVIISPIPYEICEAINWRGVKQCALCKHVCDVETCCEPTSNPPDRLYSINSLRDDW